MPDTVAHLAPGMQAGPWEGLHPPYSTIVADPPWPYPGGVSAGGTPGDPVKSFDLRYSAMSLDDISALPLVDLVADDAWLFLWATNRYLAFAFGLLPAWGFRYRQMIVWHKPGASPFGGTFAANGAEFLIAAARGDPAVRQRWGGWSVIRVNRPGAGRHSTKPGVFADLIEHCTDGPYLELFARQPRLGWDSWGWGYEDAR